VAVLVAALLVANWRTVRDHVEAWHFQLTRETETWEPIYNVEGNVLPGIEILSTYSHSAILWDVTEGISTSMFTVYEGYSLATVNKVLRGLEEDGYRVLEERCPHKAYVIIRNYEAPSERVRMGLSEDELNKLQSQVS
jgi:hypothetical protein